MINSVIILVVSSEEDLFLLSARNGLNSTMSMFNQLIPKTYSRCFKGERVPTCCSTACDPCTDQLNVGGIRMACVLKDYYTRLLLLDSLWESFVWCASASH